MTIAEALCWFVREAWPSPTTGAEQVAGRLRAGERLELTVGSDRLVVFSDGGEADRLVAARGQRVMPTPGAPAAGFHDHRLGAGSRGFGSLITVVVP